MKYLKTYEGLFDFFKSKSNKQNTDKKEKSKEDLLKENDIDINLLGIICNGTYDLENGLLNIYGDIDLNYINETKLPFKFGKITGNFYCIDGNLETLEGAPYYVGGDFDCSSNHLRTLDGGPEEVNGNFNCSLNSLETLSDAPSEVGGYFNCEYNKLDSLDMVSNIKGDILCKGNNFWHENDIHFNGWCGGVIDFKDEEYGSTYYYY